MIDIFDHDYECGPLGSIVSSFWLAEDVRQMRYDEIPAWPEWRVWVDVHTQFGNGGPLVVESSKRAIARFEEDAYIIWCTKHDVHLGKLVAQSRRQSIGEGHWSITLILSESHTNLGKKGALVSFNRYQDQLPTLLTIRALE